MAYRIAACNWKLRPSTEWSDFRDHLFEVLDECVGADIVVLPECVMLELAGERPAKPPQELVASLSELADRYEALLLQAASERLQAIVGGSHFRSDGGSYLNLTAVASGNRLTLHPKHKLTQYEVQEWDLSPGPSLTRCGQPDLGILICYDSEFPEAGRLLAESGIKILAVPAYTETRRGFQRVRWSCQARAIENQIFVVHASLCGSLGGEPVPQAVGTSAVIAPSIEPFPESAILAETGWGEAGVAMADVDLDILDRARSEGDVRNWNDRADDWRLG
ncbi:MAG: (R)-stereoselective amidase [Fimbriimonadaceae bacterium]|nr:(R)-stereoselective amidase [Fimbriimonadaceae bacterium]